MTDLKNGLSALATLVVGPAVAEFVATHKPFLTALVIVALAIGIVYCVQRANTRKKNG